MAIDPQSTALRPHVLQPGMKTVLVGLIILVGFGDSRAAEPMPRPSPEARDEAAVHFEQAKRAAAKGKRFETEGEVEKAKSEYRAAATAFGLVLSDLVMLCSDTGATACRSRSR